MSEMINTKDKKYVFLFYPFIKVKTAITEHAKYKLRMTPSCMLEVEIIVINRT